MQEFRGKAKGNGIIKVRTQRKKLGDAMIFPKFLGYLSTRKKKREQFKKRLPKIDRGKIKGGKSVHFFTKETF